MRYAVACLLQIPLSARGARRAQIAAPLSRDTTGWLQIRASWRHVPETVFTLVRTLSALPCLHGALCSAHAAVSFYGIPGADVDKSAIVKPIQAPRPTDCSLTRIFDRVPTRIIARALATFACLFARTVHHL